MREHYSDLKIEPVDFIFENSDQLNPVDAIMIKDVLKYLVRHRKKNGEEDLDKAIHYIQMVKSQVYKENK